MKRAILTVLLMLMALPVTAKTLRKPLIDVVTMPRPSSPLVSVRLMFRVGSIDDPKGKEGLAALTGLMVGSAGTAKRSFKELTEALYPMAASIGVDTDREVTTITGEVHRDKLAEYTALLQEAVLEPGFAQSDLDRNRELLSSSLTTGLRSGSDELLGLEAIQDAVYHDHPYGHPAEGTVAGLAAITLDDVKAFHREQYTEARLMVGVAGGYPEGYPEQLVAALGALPDGLKGTPQLPPAPTVAGRRITLIDKPTASVGIHIAHPLPVTRADADYYPLLVASSWLGEHRTFHGILMRELRAERGLNYGDYTYVEHWSNPPGTSHPSPNHPRRQQMFSVWIRPVAPQNARFAMRAALHFLDDAMARGITQQELDTTRNFLVGYSKLWAQTQSRRLGFLMDSRFYDMPPYLDQIEARLATLTPDAVNAAMRKYIHTDAWEAVVVTDGAAALAEALKADEPSPITYEAEVAPRVREADAVIQARKIAPTEVRIVPVAEMFER